MGRVFEARDLELKRDVALKLLHIERSDDVRARERFIREARALARLSHPNVVEVFEVGEHRGQVFIAMERLRGQTLQEWVRAQSRGWPEVLEALLQAADGLASAHAKGLVHRDIKPANIWVGDDGRVRVIDFGLAAAEIASSTARILEGPAVGPQADSRLTRTGAWVGSPAYMSPEQLTQSAATELSDQFSFCVTAFEVLHGRRPFAGTSALALLDAIEHAAVAHVDDDVPRWIDRVLLRGMHADPRTRWSSMLALRVALRRGRPRRAVAVGLAVGVGLVGAMWAGGAERDDCESRAAVTLDDSEAALDALRLPSDHARHSLTRVVDTWVERWSAEYRQTCKEGPSFPDFDATMRCLDRSRRRFAGVLGALSEVEPGQTEDMFRVVSALDTVPTCETPDDRLDDVSAEAIARVEALYAAGQYDACIREGYRHLAGMSHAGARISLLLLMARAGGQLGQYGLGVSLAEQGYFLALREGDDEGQANLGTLLVGFGHLDGAGMDVSRAWFRRVEAVLPFTRDPVRHEALLYAALGTALHDADKGADAVTAIEHALALEPDASPLTIALLEGDRGTALLGAGRLEEGRAALLRSLDVLTELLGPDHVRVSLAQTNVGTAYAMSGDLAQARPHFREALRIALAIGTEGKALGMAYGNLGLAAHVLEDYDAALSNLEAALELFEGTAWGLELRTLNNLAAVHRARGKPAEADRRLWSLVERIREVEGSDSERLVRPFYGLGNSALDQARLEEAAEYYQEAVRLAEHNRGPDDVLLVVPLTGLGEVELARGSSSRAAEHLRRAIRLMREDGDPSELLRAQLGLARAVASQPDGRAEAATLLDAAQRAATQREDTSALERVAAARAELFG